MPGIGYERSQVAAEASLPILLYSGVDVKRPVRASAGEADILFSFWICKLAYVKGGRVTPRAPATHKATPAVTYVHLFSRLQGTSLD